MDRALGVQVRQFDMGSRIPGADAPQAFAGTAVLEGSRGSCPADITAAHPHSNLSAPLGLE